MDARVILEALLPAIRHIDGGCVACMTDFCLRANEELRDANLPLAFVVADTGLVSVEEAK